MPVPKREPLFRGEEVKTRPFHVRDGEIFHQANFVPTKPAFDRWLRQAIPKAGDRNFTSAALEAIKKLK